MDAGDVASRRDAPQIDDADACVIPPRLPIEIAGKYLVDRSDAEDVEKRHIIEYVEMETEDETVKHLEKVKSERIYGKAYDVWDVRTDKSRWWVITNLTNLYPQEQFESLDYTFSFHVGLMTRIAARDAARGDDDDELYFAASWRRFRQAYDAWDHADEAEEFQAVGLRCRECLLELVREGALVTMVPEEVTPPKMGNFVHWSELIADYVAPGDRNERIRGYLKALSQSTWELVQWLVHTSSATRLDAMMAMDATRNVLSVLGMPLVRKERGTPDRCPSCSSYQLISDYRDVSTVTVCKRCGWESEPADPYADDAED